MEQVKYKVGKVAEMLGITTRTIRYYEEEGLISPQRTEKGTRMYMDPEVERLRLITQMTENGFSLEMVKSFLPVDISKRKVTTTSVLDIIVEKVNKLGALKEAISKLD